MRRQRARPSRRRRRVARARRRSARTRWRSAGARRCDRWNPGPPGRTHDRRSGRRPRGGCRSGRRGRARRGRTRGARLAASGLLLHAQAQRRRHDAASGRRHRLGGRPRRLRRGCRGGRLGGLCFVLRPGQPGGRLRLGGLRGFLGGGGREGRFGLELACRLLLDRARRLGDGSRPLLGGNGRAAGGVQFSRLRVCGLRLRLRRALGLVNGLGCLDEAGRAERRCRWLRRLRRRLLAGRTSCGRASGRPVREDVAARQGHAPLAREPVDELPAHDFFNRARGALHLDAVIALEQRHHFLAGRPEQLRDFIDPNCGQRLPRIPYRSNRLCVSTDPRARCRCRS